MGTLSDIYRGVATWIAHTVNTMGGWLALICMVAWSYGPRAWRAG